MVLPDLRSTFQSLMVTDDRKGNPGKVKPYALDRPHDRARFELQKNRIALVGQNYPTQKRNGTNLTVRLLLLEVSSESTLASVTEQSKRS